MVKLSKTAGRKDFFFQMWTFNFISIKGFSLLELGASIMCISDLD